MQSPVEIRYEGTVIGRASAVSGTIDDGGTLFLDTQEPMPVGTKLELHAAGQVAQVRVVRVSEASDTVAAGMIVRAVGAHDPIDIPMPPLIPPKPAAPPPAVQRPGTSKGMGTAPALPVATARPGQPGPLPSAVKGEIHTPAPAPRAPATPPPPPVVVQDHEVPEDVRGQHPDHDHDDDGVPEHVTGEGTNGSNELSSPAEMSGVIETGGSTAELPSMGNGANRRRRSRRRR